VRSGSPWVMTAQRRIGRVSGSGGVTGEGSGVGSGSLVGVDKVG
jgi:hypothetical protein